MNIQNSSKAPMKLPVSNLPSNVSGRTNGKGGQTNTVRPTDKGHGHISLFGTSSGHDVLKLYGHKNAWQVKDAGHGHMVYVNKNTKDVIVGLGFEKVKFQGGKK